MKQVAILLVGIVALQNSSAASAQAVLHGIKGSTHQVAPQSGDVKLPNSKSSNASKIKAKVKSLGIAGRVTVVLKNNNEYYGAISQIGEDSFQLADVDLKQQITVSYDEVKKVISGFGNPNPFNGKRWHPSWHIAAVAAVVGLTVLIVVVGASATR